MSLGDVVNTDASYTGADSSSVISVDYYRQKATEFQATLVALDITLQAASASIDDSPDDVAAQLSELIAEANGKKGMLVAAAEALNAVASAANSVGVRFPVLSIPSTLEGLGVAPVIAIAGAVAAVAGAAALIVWANDWMNRVYAAQQTALEAAQSITDPQQRDTALANLSTQSAKTAAAMSDSSGSPLGQVANIVKWGAIAFLVYLGWKAFDSTQHHAGQ